MSTALYLALASSVASGLAASIAWWVKLRWADEYKLATEQAAKAKEAEIAALKTQLDLLQTLHSGKLLEDAASTKTGLEKIIDRVERERDPALLEIEEARADANREIGELRGKLASLPSSTGNQPVTISVRAEQRLLSTYLSESEREERTLHLREVQLRAQMTAQKMLTVSQTIAQLEAQAYEIEGLVRGENHTWLEEQQDAHAKMRRYQEQNEELVAQIVELRNLDNEAHCPTCRQVVGNIPNLLAELEDQLIVFGLDAKWWTKKYEQVQKKPERIVELEEHMRALQMKVSDAMRVKEELGYHHALLMGEIASLEARSDDR
jgi:hypothetical protein